MDNNEKVNEEIIEEEVIVEEAKVKKTFVEKIKSNKVVIGLGVTALVGAGFLLKAMTSSKDTENDGVIDADYTECPSNESTIEYHEEVSVEEKSENE